MLRVKSISRPTGSTATREPRDFREDASEAVFGALACGDAAAYDAFRTVVETAHGTLIETTNRPLSIQPPRSTIARDGLDHVCIVIALPGRGVIDQGSRLDVLRPGDVILYDLGRRNMVAAISSDDYLRLNVPRDTFAKRVGRIETLSGLRLPAGNGLVDLFTTYVHAYAAAMPRFSQREADAGMATVLHLLSGLVNTSLSASSGGGGALARDILLALALRHIEVLLGDAALDVSTLARTIGVSRSRLYDVFVARGGVASAIRHARLDRARLFLAAHGERHRTLEEIAQFCGFVEYSTFAKAFRRRFGMSPNNARVDEIYASS